MQSVTEWAQLNFGTCELGDKRRTKRLVILAEQLGSHPSGSLPHQISDWGDLKAGYRLFSQEAVTFEAIARPHWELTKRAARGRCLVIGDTTEVDFGSQRQIQGLGPTGNGSGQGFLLHNALLVDAESEAIIGVAGQTIHYRPRKAKRKGRKNGKKPLKSKRENSAQILKRNRESEVWGTVIDQIGKPAEGVEYVHVFDRGADNFEVYCRLIQNQSHWVIRASRLNRDVLVGQSENPKKLSAFLKTLKTVGHYELDLRVRPDQPARAAQLEVRIGEVKIPRPKHVSPWVKSLQQAPIAMYVVEVVETNAPKDVTPIRWTLLTSLPVTSFEEAWVIIGYYEKRWLIEEYHKALKTGCNVEKRQLKTADRLEAFVGLSSVTAVRLLQLKSLARTNPDTPAAEVVPSVWLEMLKLARKKLLRVHELTVGQFYREVAKLGGFLGRKSDGEPGWITIWRGWEKLNMFIYVASTLKTA